MTNDGSKEGGSCAFDAGACPHEIFVITDLPSGTYPFHCPLLPIMWSMVEVGIPLAT